MLVGVKLFGGWETFYRSTASLEQDPSEYGGVFDGVNPENPFATYTMVYLPT